MTKNQSRRKFQRAKTIMPLTLAFVNHTNQEIKELEIAFSVHYKPKHAFNIKETHKLMRNCMHI